MSGEVALEFIFWKNILCHLQSSFIRELAASSDVKVTLVVDQVMTGDEDHHQPGSGASSEHHRPVGAGSNPCIEWLPICSAFGNGFARDVGPQPPLWFAE